MRIRQKLSLGLAWLFAVPLLRAEVPPGRWEKVEALAPGTSIVLRLASGDRVEGLFRGIGADAVTVSEPGAAERTFPKALIRTIETSTRIPDRLRDGVLIGALLGAGAGVAAMVGFAHAVTNGPVDWGGEDGAAYLLGAALVGAGVGAAGGAVVDAAVKGPERLYRAR